MKLKLAILLLGLGFSLNALAESLVQFEHKLIEQYSQPTLSGGRIEADQYNDDIAAAVIEKLNTDPASFDYDFKALVDQGMLNIHYSPDRLIKIYNLDLSSGGTMREFSNIAQYKQAGKIKTQTLEQFGLTRSIQQSQLNQKTTYFVLEHYIGSSCDGSISMQALQMQAKILAPAAVFKSRSQVLSDISVPYSCREFPEKSAYARNYSLIGQALIQPAANMQYIDFRLMNEQLAPQQKFLRYQKQGGFYVYQGTVNTKD